MATKFQPINTNRVLKLMQEMSRICDGYSMLEACVAFNQFAMHQAVDAAKENRLTEKVLEEGD